MSPGKCSKILFSKVLSLSLRDLLAPVLLVQEGMKAEVLLLSRMFLGCQSPREWRAGTGDLTAAMPGSWASLKARARGCWRRWDPSVASHALVSPAQGAFTLDQPGCLCVHTAPGCPCAGISQPCGPASWRVSEKPPSAAAKGDSGTLLVGPI